MELEDYEDEMEVKEDDSSSSDDDLDEELNEAKQLESQLSNNKYLYDVHVQLVKLYEKLGDLNSLRAAYERFHEVFPLTSELWLQWIHIEIKLAVNEDDQKKVFKLFDKAVEDYLSVSLWLEYARYKLDVGSLETTKEILEKALNSAGLNAKDGSLLWDFLREIELGELSSISIDNEKWKEQADKVVEIFRRQLSVPLLDMELTYSEWQKWFKSLPDDFKVKSDQVEWGYKRALEKLEVVKRYENELLSAKDIGDNELCEVYKKYMENTEDPSTKLCLFERAVADLCLLPNLWLDYCNFVIKFGEPAMSVANRSLRNCTWSEDLWIIKIRIMETLSKDEKEILKCFEDGLLSVAPSPGIKLWLTYLEYVNRNETNKEKLYKLFDQAIETINFEADQNCTIERLYTRILASNSKLKEARSIWNKIIGRPHNKINLSMWLEYLSMEKQYGEPKQLRALYQRAIGSCKDWAYFIGQEWLLYERQYGSLQDVLKCIEKCKNITAPQTYSQEIINDDDSHNRKRKHEPELRKPVKKTKKEEVLPEPRKAPISKDPSTTVFISNIMATVTEKTLKTMFPNALNIQVIHDRNRRGKCYAYVQFSMEEEVMHALARDREPLDGRPVFISSCKPDKTERPTAFKYATTVEENKLFVRGLPIPMTEKEVLDIFKPYGAITVRLVIHRSGKQKGLAYVEFPDSESTKQALLKTDQIKVKDHVITVAVSAPPPKKSKDEVEEPIRHARSRLGVTFVPRALQIKKSEGKNDSNGSQNGAGTSKNNDDFRKMLLK